MKSSVRWTHVATGQKDMAGVSDPLLRPTRLELAQRPLHHTWREKGHTFTYERFIT